eukprot:2100543-Rhodomonas_salina.5
MFREEGTSSLRAGLSLVGLVQVETQPEPERIQLEVQKKPQAGLVTLRPRPLFKLTRKLQLALDSWQWPEPPEP